MSNSPISNPGVRMKQSLLNKLRKQAAHGLSGPPLQQTSVLPQQAMQGAQGLTGVPGPTGATVLPDNKVPSNTRFRSFAERYVVERAHWFPVGKEIEAAWETISQARTIYNMIKERGRTLKDDT